MNGRCSHLVGPNPGHASENASPEREWFTDSPAARKSSLGALLGVVGGLVSGALSCVSSAPTCCAPGTGLCVGCVSWRGSCSCLNWAFGGLPALGSQPPHTQREETRARCVDSWSLSWSLAQDVGRPGTFSRGIAKCNLFRWGLGCASPRRGMELRWGCGLGT